MPTFSTCTHLMIHIPFFDLLNSRMHNSRTTLGKRGPNRHLVVFLSPFRTFVLSYLRTFVRSSFRPSALPPFRPPFFFCDPTFLLSLHFLSFFLRQVSLVPSYCALVFFSHFYFFSSVVRGLNLPVVCLFFPFRFCTVLLVLLPPFRV
jgi:hypothetical protein